MHNSSTQLNPTRPNLYELGWVGLYYTCDGLGISQPNKGCVKLKKHKPPT